MNRKNFLQSRIVLTQGGTLCDKLIKHMFNWLLNLCAQKVKYFVGKDLLREHIDWKLLVKKESETHRIQRVFVDYLSESRKRKSKEFNNNNGENHSRNSLCFHWKYHSPCLNTKVHQHIITQISFLRWLSLSSSHVPKLSCVANSAYHRMARKLISDEKLMGVGGS